MRARGDAAVELCPLFILFQSACGALKVTHGAKDLFNAIQSSFASAVEFASPDGVINEAVHTVSAREGVAFVAGAANIAAVRSACRAGRRIAIEAGARVRKAGIARGREVVAVGAGADSVGCCGAGGLKMETCTVAGGVSEAMSEPCTIWVVAGSANAPADRSGKSR
jgi:hypothetical protein